MDDVEIVGNIDEIYGNILKLMFDQQLPVDIAYLMCGSIFSRLALQIGRPVDKVIADIQATFEQESAKNQGTV